MPAKNKASAAEAELILKLYDLRREEVMRKARHFMAVEFWPQSYDDLLKVLTDFGSQQNAYFRQVTGYWEMAASLVLHGALDEDLFYDNSGEMYFIFTKCRPYVKRLREEMKAPEAFANVEKLATRTPRGRDRLARMEENFKRWAEMRAAKAAGQ